jgi:hypothetical protein
MKLSYKMRRLLSVVILLIGLPLYIVVAVSILSLFGRLPIFLELFIYICLGVIWAFPLKTIFRGIGQINYEDQNEK